MEGRGLQTRREKRGQSIWGYKVAAYLFLAGVGAGAYAAGAAVGLTGIGWVTAHKAGVTLGPLLVLGSTIFLIADLGAPGSFLRAGAKPRSSWISRGVIILTAFIIIGLVNLLFSIWPWHILAGAGLTRRILEGVGIILALLTMVYTGLLLGAVRPIPFWNNPMLPVLFLLSALSTGVMANVLTMSFIWFATGASVHRELAGFARIDAIILALESIVVFFYLQGCYTSIASRPSANLLLTGPFSAPFWLGLVGAGLAVPFAFEVAQSSLGYGTNSGLEAGLAVAASVPGLAGGLLLRYLIVAGGVRVPLKVGSIMVSIPNKARF